MKIQNIKTLLMKAAVTFVLVMQVVGLVAMQKEEPSSSSSSSSSTSSSSISSDNCSKKRKSPSDNHSEKRKNKVKDEWGALSLSNKSPWSSTPSEEEGKFVTLSSRSKSSLKRSPSPQSQSSSSSSSSSSDFKDEVQELSSNDLDDLACSLDADIKRISERDKKEAKKYRVDDLVGAFEDLISQAKQIYQEGLAKQQENLDALKALLKLLTYSLCAETECVLVLGEIDDLNTTLLIFNSNLGKIIKKIVRNFVSSLSACASVNDLLKFDAKDVATVEGARSGAKKIEQMVKLMKNLPDSLKSLNTSHVKFLDLPLLENVYQMICSGINVGFDFSEYQITKGQMVNMVEGQFCRIYGLEKLPALIKKAEALLIERRQILGE